MSSAKCLIGTSKAHLCLCHDCYSKSEEIAKKWQSPEDFKEPHPKYPECNDCYAYYSPLLKEVIEKYCGEHLPAPPKRRGAPKADPETEWAFTLTMPPDYEPKKPIEEAARLILSHGLTSKPYERPERWAFVKEHTEKGVPHIHGVYKTPSGRRIEQKYFQRYWPLWDEKVKLGVGHKGGYHLKARHGESYSAYMEKEGEVVHSEDSPDLISHV